MKVIPRHPILIVDDEPDVLDTLRYLFHRRYEVLTAESGDAALHILAEREVHVILTDQRMPAMTGDELLSRARELQPDAVRLLFTGYADIQAVIDAVNRGGIFRYVHKPWDPAELESIVHQAARQFELLAERKRLVAELQERNQALRNANQELEEADQLKTAFLEVASHEFNTPITIIQGMAELLQISNPNRPETEHRLLQQLSKSTKQLSKLVSNTLTMIEAGTWRNPLHCEPSDPVDIVRAVVEQLSPIAVGRGLRLEFRAPEPLGPFDLDPEKIRDAVTHIVSNAIKFTPDGGLIEVSVDAEHEGAVIAVRDHGIGMEPRALRRLFEPFFTEFDPSHHSSGEFGFNQRGLGLGLTLAKKFVDLHGGRIEAASSPGLGTRIAVQLPKRACPGAVGEVQFIELAGPSHGESFGG